MPRITKPFLDAMPYKTFEHTADIGLKISATDLKGLFKNAAEGFYNIVTDLDAVKNSPNPSTQKVEMNFQEENAAELFMHWLQELLFFFSARKLILLDFNFISLTPMVFKLKGGNA